MNAKTFRAAARPAAPPGAHGLPVTGDLTLVYALSLAITLLMALASAVGLLYPARVYPADELLQSFVANDAVNLLLGVPILLGSMWLARRGKLIGLLFWPGTLMYVLYNYLAYVFGAPPGWTWALYLVLAATSTSALVALLARIDGQVVRRRLAGAVPEKLSGGILVGFGVLIWARAVGTVAAALLSQAAVPATEWPVLVADFVMAPLWVIGGVLLFRRRALGYVSGAGLLFQASALFIGLIAFLLLQPLLTAAPFVLGDVIAVSGMGLICFVPFGLFVRGVVSRGG